MMTVPEPDIHVLGEVDEKTWEQGLLCLAAEPGSFGAYQADNHLGYNSHPVGFAAAFREHISASGVGVDIACGNKAVGTGMTRAQLDELGGPRWIMDEIWRHIDIGIGKNQSPDVDHPVIDTIRESPAEFQRGMLDLAANQLGSTGGGNHYVDIFEDVETGEIVVGVHFGSRGFGNKTCTHYVKEQGAFATPTMLRLDSGEGQEYLEAMRVAGEYAYAGRDVVVDKVLGLLGVDEPTWSVHNHHNFAWQERHRGEDFWVVRKGCTPAAPGQFGFVGATMGEDSVILRGSHDETDEVRRLQEATLFSTVHGAGRAMSRGKAAGRRKKRWACNNRDCDWVQPPHTHKPEDGACPRCGHPRVSKQWIQLEDGVIDWDAEREKMGTIELRGGAADEAPGAYKRLAEVIEAQGPTIVVTRTLRPIGVAMAGQHVPSDD
jgi:tRNA-splicing ligase RtcB